MMGTKNLQMHELPHKCSYEYIDMVLSAGLVWGVWEEEADYQGSDQQHSRELYV